MVPYSVVAAPNGDVGSPDQRLRSDHSIVAARVDRKRRTGSRLAGNGAAPRESCAGRMARDDGLSRCRRRVRIGHGVHLRPTGWPRHTTGCRWPCAPPDWRSAMSSSTERLSCALAMKRSQTRTPTVTRRRGKRKSCGSSSRNDFRAWTVGMTPAASRTAGTRGLPSLLQSVPEKALTQSSIKNSQSPG